MGQGPGGRVGGQQEGGDSVQSPRPVPSRPVSSPSRLLVPLGDGWDARPCPSTTDPSQLRRGQVCRSTASIAGGGRASARWPPTHRYLEQGICKSAQVPRPAPLPLPRFPC